MPGGEPAMAAWAWLATLARHGGHGDNPSPFSWAWRPDVVLVLLLACLLVALGWWRLRQKGRRPPSLWRLLAYAGGLVALGLALISPIDALGEQLLLFHMVQHLLLLMVAPPLLWLGQPFPLAVWGMPALARRVVVRALNRRSRARTLLLKLASPGVVWLLFTSLLAGWHDASAYDAALEHPLVHDAEHLSFFLAGMLYWWVITGAAPVLGKRLSRPVKAAFALAAVPPNMIIGAAIAFAERPLYSHYLAVPRLFGLSPLHDQQLGGLVMWIPGSMMYILAALVVLYRLVSDEGQKPALEEEMWAGEQQVRAPGLHGG